MLGPSPRMLKNSDYPPGVARRWIIMISKEADKDNVQAGASFNTSYLYEIFPVLTKKAILSRRWIPLAILLFE